MLSSHYRFVSVDSDIHRENEKCRHVPTKEPLVNRVDELLVDDVEHILLLVDFCQ